MKEYTITVAGMPVVITRTPRYLGEFFRTVPMAWVECKPEEYRIPLRERGRLCANNHFLLLSEPTREALIWHEKGHQMLGHMHLSFALQLADDYHRDQAHKRDLACPRELEADQYAIQQIGLDAFVEALHEFLILAEKMLVGTTFKMADIYRRIKHWERCK
jgi:hypothetical protein